MRYNLMVIGQPADLPAAGLCDRSFPGRGGWFLLFFLSWLGGWSQPARISFDHLNIREGLPADGAFDILQDRQGYIWMATINGLVRYDGYQFNIFRSTAEVTQGKQHPSGRAFVSLLEAKNGMIWASSLNGGFTCYDPDKEVFTNYPIPKKSSPYTRHDLVMEDSEGRIWMYEVDRKAPKARLKCVNPQSRTVKTYPLIHKLASKVEFKGFLDQDSKGNLYALLPDSGIQILAASDSVFVPFLSLASPAKSTEKSPFPGAAKINHLRIDQADRLWASTDQGLFLFDLNTRSWVNDLPLFAQQPGLKSGSISYTYEDQQGRVWTFAKGKQLLGYDLQSQQSLAFGLDVAPLNTLDHAANSFLIIPVLEDEEGVWFINETERLAVYPRHFFHFNWKSRKLTSYGETFNQPQNRPNNTPVAFLHDQGGIMWIGNLGSGVNRENPIITRVDRWGYTPGNSLDLDTDSIIDVAEDKVGNIWITGHGIIQRFDEKNSTFQAYSPKEYGKVIFNTLLEDEQEALWIGSNQGLFRFDKQSQDFSLKLALDQKDGVAISPLFFDKKGHLWLSFIQQTLGSEYGQALGVFDMGSSRLIKKYTHDPTDPGSLPGNAIMDVLHDRKGRVWVATLKGLCQYQERTDNFLSYVHDPQDSTSISHNALSFLYEDSQSRLWIGTFIEGLNLFEEATQTFRRWKDPNSFLAILSAMEGKDGNLWLGTYRGEGLFKMDKNTRALSYYNKEDGIASERILSITLDARGYLWMPSESGLTRFDPLSEQFEIFREEDGFLPFDDSDIPQYTRPFRSSRGDIWFNSFTNLYRVQPEKFFSSISPPPQVLITSLKIGQESFQAADGKLIDRHISRTAGLRLDYEQNDLIFEFTGLHFARPEDNRYTYILEGFDDEWSLPSTERRVRYSGLPPGDYTFRVKASNAEGVWATEGASMHLSIAQAWWKTQGAIMAYILLLGLLIWLFVRWTTRKQQQKIKAQEEEIRQEKELSEQLKALDLLKDQFLANTSHELRTPLNGIIGLSEGVYDRAQTPVDREDLGLIISSGKRLHYLVDDILDFSKMKKGEYQLNTSPVELKSVVDLVIRMSEASVGKKDIKLLNEISDNLPAVMADAYKLQQILHNLVGNAVKFTQEGKVRISAELKDKEVKVSVQDTGVGIPLVKQEIIFEEFQQGDGSTARNFGGTGLGLSITKQLVQLHGGRIGVHSEWGKGSTFWFTLQVSSEKGKIFVADEESQTLISSRLDLNPNGKEAESPTQLLAGPSKAPEDAPKIRILIVDDEPVNQRVIKNHLDSQKFELTFADDGQQALQIMDSVPRFDLVLLDVMMPNMSGYEVCNKIREKYLPSELPVIMVTAKNQVTDLVEGLNKGANDYLAKPFSRQEFLARVKTQIDLLHIFNITDRFIPNEFIRSLGHERITEVKLGDLVERVVSVLFTDIRSYTTLSEAMSPEDTFRFVSSYTNRMGPIIYTYRGFVNQYLGDGIMAIFQYSPDDALDSMIGMQEILRAYNLERAAKGRIEIAVGMGLHTGSLIMGIIGDSRRTDAATISDTVNTAARMEGLTKVFGVRILISGDSFSNLEKPEKYRFRYIGKVKVKGKNESVGVYECIDGDPEQESELKWNYRREFEVGVTHYYGQQYQDAIQIMGTLVQHNPSDRVAAYFLEEAIKAQQAGILP